MNMISLTLFLMLTMCMEIVANDLGGLGDLAKIFSILSGGDSCTLKCPNGDQPQPNKNHKPSHNGCGPAGMKIETVYKGFEECCNKHDICYDTCNSDRNVCDEKFKNCLKLACEIPGNSSMKKNKKECDSSREIMYSGAVGLGCGMYKESQRQACLCDGRTLTIQEMERADSAEL